MRFIRVSVLVIFIFVSAFTGYVYATTKQDYTGPVIQSDTDVITVSVDDDDSAYLKHITASDEKDGNLTSSVIVESISSFITDNSAKVTFAVCDSDNNVAKLEKNLVFSDYKKPEFALSSQRTYYVGASKVDLMAGITADDILEGDISSRIVVINSDIDLSSAGVYPVTYRVATSKGIKSDITVNAYVYDSRLPLSIKLNSYLVYTDVNKKLNPNSYVSSYPDEMLKDGYDNYYNYTFSVTDETNYEKPGTYVITYRLNKTSKQDKNDTAIVAESYLTVVVRGDSQ